MNDLEKRVQSGVIHAIFMALFMHIILTCSKALYRRREARGRHGAVVYQLHHTLNNVMRGVAAVGAFLVARQYVKVDQTNAIATIIIFLLVLLIGLLIGAILAWTFTFITLGIVELADQAQGRTFPRPGHYMTLDEINLEGSQWASVVANENSKVVRNGLFLIGGVGTPLGAGLINRDQAQKEIARCIVLRDRIAAGQPVWVND